MKNNLGLPGLVCFPGSKGKRMLSFAGQIRRGDRKVWAGEKHGAITKEGEQEAEPDFGSKDRPGAGALIRGGLD
jgi:hypothetical protein